MSNLTGYSLSNNSEENNLVLSTGDGNHPGVPSGVISVGGGQNPINYTGFRFETGSLDSAPKFFHNITPSAAARFHDTRWLMANADFDQSFVAALGASVINASMITLTSDGCKFRMITDPGELEATSYNTTCSHPHLNASSYWDTFNVVATTCTFYPCVKDYHAIVNDAVLTESIIRETPAAEAPHNPGVAFPDHQHFNTHCFVNGQPYSPGNVSSIFGDSQTFNVTSAEGRNVSVPHECLYSINGIYLRALSTFLADTLR
jgi:hypothetical protein